MLVDNLTRRLSKGLTPGLMLVLTMACATPAASPTPAAPAAAPAKTAPTANSGQAAAPTAAAAPQTATKPGSQKLVFAISTPASEANEIFRLANTDIWAIRPMYEYLIGTEPDTGKFIPQLATEWAIEPDGKSVRFQLRKGVQFHNGFGEFTAKDVVFTWQDMKQEASVNGWRTFYANAISDIEVVNDYEIVIRMARNDSNIINIVSEGENGFEIRSKANADAQGGVAPMDGKPYAGTAPFQFKERAQGQYIKFERVPYQHWRVTPDFAEIEFRFQREASTRAAALQAGEAQITVLPPDIQNDAVKRGSGTVVSKVPGLRTFMRIYCCILNDPKDASKGWLYPDSPLLDVRVRKALNKAVNRDELNKAFFDNKGEQMILPMHHPTRQGWDPSWVQRWPEEYGFDPAASRALLAEAGYSQSKPLTTNLFITPLPSVGPAQDVQEAVAGYWRSVGVGVELLSTDPGEVTAQARQRKFSNNIQMQSTNSAMFTGMTGYFLTWGARNNGLEDPEWDQYTLDAVSTFDEAKQNEAWRKVGEEMFKKQPDIPLFWLPAEATVNPKVVGSYVFPGNVTGTWTHLYTIKAAS